jgi:hypothetical protein
MRKSLMLAVCTAALAISGCSGNKDEDSESAKVTNTAYPEQVFWGDTHLHTDNSIDAFGFGNRLDAEAALICPRRRSHSDQRGQGEALPPARFSGDCRSQRRHGRDQGDHGSASDRPAHQ